MTVDDVRANYKLAKSAKIDDGERMHCAVCGAHSHAVGTGTHRYHKNAGVSGPPTVDLCDKCRAQT
jgi:hypothetical protein